MSPWSRRRRLTPISWNTARRTAPWWPAPYRPAEGRAVHGLFLLPSRRGSAQPGHLHDPGSCARRTGAEPALRLSGLLGARQRQDGLQDPLLAAGSAGPEWLGRVGAVAGAAHADDSANYRLSGKIGGGALARRSTSQSIDAASMSDPTRTWVPVDRA